MAASPDDMTASPEDMAASPEDMAASPEDMAASSEGMAASSEGMAASSEDTAASPEDMAASSEDMAASSKEMAASPEDMAASPDDPVTGVGGGIDLYPSIEYTADNQLYYESLIVGFTNALRELWPGPTDLFRLNATSSDKFVEILLDDHPCIPRRCDRFLRCSTRSAMPDNVDHTTEPSAGACLVLLSALFNGQPLRPCFQAAIVWSRARREEPLNLIHGVYFETELAQLRKRWAEEDASNNVGAMMDGLTIKYGVKPPGGGIPYAIGPVPGKGFGITATRQIQTGECIVAEKPALSLDFGEAGIQYPSTLEKRIAEFVKMLSADEKNAFSSLVNAFKDEMSDLAGIWRTNALDIPTTQTAETAPQDGALDTSWTSAIFFTISRFNHSCQPNAHFSWDEENEKMAVYAVRDIAKDDEITVSYLGSCLAGFEARQEWLSENFSFVCRCCLCAACTEHAAHQTASDRRRREAREFMREPDSVSESKKQRKTRDLNLDLLCSLPTVRHVLQQLRLERLHDDNLVLMWAHAAKLAISAGDKVRAYVFGRRAWEAQTVLSGPEHRSTKAISMFLAQPARMGEWRSGMIREPVTFEEPKGLSEAEYEEWLWDGDQEWGWK